MLKNVRKIIIIVMLMLILVFTTNVNAHGGNITGWKDKESSKIVEYNGKYYGYHNQDGVRHYHQVEWDEKDKKWNIINPAVYYDENFNVINSASEAKTTKVEVKYYKKVDGDTAKFELNGEIITVRFLGINTPETVDKKRGEEPYGKEASEYTSQRLENGNMIELEYDENASAKDKYDRVLAWVWVDDSLLQEELVEKGLAETYMLQNNYKYAGTLQLAQDKAKNEKIGIWSNEIESTNNIENENKLEIGKQDTNEIYIFITIIVLSIVAILVKNKCKIKKKKS
mgnify:CR=1 FL=1